MVGPNASGKTTFLDIMAFLGQFVSDGLEAAVGDRTRNFQICYGREKVDHSSLPLRRKSRRIGENFWLNLGLIRSDMKCPSG